MTIIDVLAINAAVSAACFAVLWLVAIALKDPSFVDAWWALGMVLIAWTTLAVTGERGAHAWMLVGLASAWGVRLGAHLFARWRADGPDRRYVSMMAAAKTERGWSFATASLLLVFALQAPLQFVVSLPVQLGQIREPGFVGPMAWIGAVLALVGIAFETIGDWQLSRFRARRTDPAAVLDTGLWRYTRHPNYFGDACVWWGLFLVAADTTVGAWALPGPVLITFLLTRWSGVPTVEGRMKRRKPGYEAYVARTSGFIPWPPKKR